MHKLGVLFFVVLIFSLHGCQNSTERSATYFDSLIVTQINRLSEAKPSLTKRATMDGKTDISTSHPSPATWQNELEVFRQLALFERPTFSKSYLVVDGLKDEKSNLLIKQYASKDDIPIPLLKLYYYDHFVNLRRIEATYHKENALYSTSRHLVLEFEEIKGKPWLSAYAVDGFEKVVLSDSVKFSVDSRINY